MLGYALNAVYVEQFDFVKRPASKRQQWSGLKKINNHFFGWGGYLNKQISRDWSGRGVGGVNNEK